MKCTVKIKFIGQNEMLIFEDDTDNIEELQESLSNIFTCEKISSIQTSSRIILLKPTRIDCIIIEPLEPLPITPSKEKSTSTSKKTEQIIKNTNTGTITK